MAQDPMRAFLATLAVVDAWLANLPEPTPQTCMITAGAIAGEVFCDSAVYLFIYAVC